MFGLFKRKSKIELLHDKYNALIKEAYELSKINRLQSDMKTAEAERILAEINLIVEESPKQMT